MTLGDSDDSLNVGSEFTAALSISKGRLYEILKSAAEDGRTPIFELTIPE